MCGVQQYPKQRVCVGPDCGAIDQMEDYYFHDKVGTIRSFTRDNLAFSKNPPAVYGFIDFDEGGRLYLDITDCADEDLRVGARVRMGLRRRYVDQKGSTYTYFWKAVPVSNQNE